MSRPSPVAWIVGGVATALSLTAMTASCGRFGAEEEPPGAEGGAGEAAVEPAAERDVRVEVGWPTVQTLDPARDIRAAKMRVVVTDAVDPSRTVEKTLASIETGPFDFPGFRTSSLVDVTVEIFGRDDRLLGYGERRRWDLVARATVPVAARRRLLYFTSGDREDGQLRTLGLTPSEAAEPGMDEPSLPPLASLTRPAGLAVTRDGLLLVQAGRPRLSAGGAAAGALAVFETGSHALARTVPLSFAPAGIAPLGEGRHFLVAPDGSSPTTIFAVVDVETGVSTDVPSGLMGGAVEIWSVAASPDGTRAAAAGSYTESNSPKAYVFFYDNTSGKLTSRDLTGALDVARGVRFTPDGKSLVVAGANRSADWATGALLMFDTSKLGPAALPEKTIALAAGTTRSSSLILHPDGRHAYVSHETRYGTGSCCGEMRIIDVASMNEVYASEFSDSGPEFEILAAVRLPYAPHRVLGGQSDHGNNVHGPLVELSAGGSRPVAVKVTAEEDIGSINDLATPFGARL